MKKLLLFISLGFFLSCSNVQHPDFERNLETTKQWFESFGNEDLDFTMSFFAEEIEYQSAFYEGPIMNKEETTEYFKGWHDAMENISYEAENYLPGVDPDTGLLNGSVRTYGNWSGTSTASGKNFTKASNSPKPALKIGTRITCCARSFPVVFVRGV